MAIEQAYVESHPGSAALARRAGAVLPSGVTHDSRYLRPFGIYVDRAAGARKWDVDGHEYIDYVMGHGSLLLGHSHPAVTEAAMAQLARGTHYGASHEREIEWAEEVVRIVPSAEAVRFTSSGTEATLMALRIARAASGRPAVLKFDRHFHGWHDYVVGASSYGSKAPAGVPESTLESVVVVPPDLATVRETLAGRPDVGAVIVEAAGASSGAVPLPRGFNAELARIAHERGALFIMDEVVTGFRWSPGGVQQIEGVTPDLTALAKILAGGLPGGAVAGRRDLLERLAFPLDPGVGKPEKIGHPGTFNANPLSATAGVTCLRTIADGQAQERASALAGRLRAGMNRELARMGVPGVVYGQASAFRVIVGRGTPPAPVDIDPRDLPADRLAGGMAGEVQRLLVLAMLNRGVHLFGNSGLTSAVHTDADIAQTLDAWAGSLAALREEGVL
jgi:glutamate-1-semialdehyde 2,1-aminomutase